MTDFIKEQIAVLVELQSLDNKTRSLQLTLSEVDSQLAELDRNLESVETDHKNQKDALADLRKLYRDFEREIQTHRSRIEKDQDKTRSVKTNKEYQAILKEIDDSKAKVSAIEDQMIEILEKIETAETVMASQQKDLESEKSEVAQKKKVITEEANEQQRALDSLTRDRAVIESKLAPEILTRFKSVKAKVGLLGIAAVKKSVCKGCHVNIPPQLFNELQRYETLLQCPNCQRIIFYQAGT